MSVAAPSPTPAPASVAALASPRPEGSADAKSTPAAATTSTHTGATYWCRSVAQHDTQGLALCTPRGLDIDTKTKITYVAGKLHIRAVWVAICSVVSLGVVGTGVDTDNNRICRIDNKDGKMSVLSGRPDVPGHKDGKASKSLFDDARDVRWISIQSER